MTKNLTVQKGGIETTGWDVVNAATMTTPHTHDADTVIRQVVIALNIPEVKKALKSLDLSGVPEARRIVEVACGNSTS